MSEQHEWDFTGVNRPTVKEIKEELSIEEECDLKNVPIYVGGHRSGKSKALKDMVQRFELNKEIFKDFERVLSDELWEMFEYYFNPEQGVLTVEVLDTYGERKETKKFRLVEVRE